MAQTLTTNFAQAANRSNPNKLIGGQTFHVSLQRSLIGRGSIMLALLLSVLVNLGWGQSYTAENYRFLNSPHISAVNTHPHFVWSSSNGYGQWTAMEDGSWYLWSNRLGDYNPNSVPPSTEGAVAGGSLGFISPQNDPDIPKDIKVTCNLLGDVRYVWPDAVGGNPVPARGQFVIKGFSEASRGGNPPIDISFAGIPKAQNSREVIKGGGIQSFTNQFATTDIQGVYHPPYKANSNQPEPFETDWRDIFDIACDGHYLYIVWEAKRPSTNIFDIYATVVTLSTSTVVTGYPKIIDQGRRPTVACDVRNNSNSSSPQVTFDIAYISSIPQFGQAGTGVVMHSATVNGATQNSITQPTNFLEPILQTGFVFYDKPMHARILVASAKASAPPVKAIYVIADDGDNSQTYGNLLFHRIINVNTPTPVGNEQAFYVDGSRITAHPAPLESGTTHSSFEVWNTHIMAFANPYDGEANIDYDEFHCLYSMDAFSSNLDPITQALHIVRGKNTSIFPPTPETRKLINIRSTNNGSSWIFTQGPDLGEYIGSVNQMGIHVHWAEPHGRYYNRDRRAFDEPIEENTLITDTCIVEDGTSHQGTNSITVLPGKRVTLWSDLKYLVGGAPGNQANKYGNYMNRVGDEICPGNFQPSTFKGEYHAKLFLYGTASVNVGTGNASDEMSKLTMLPNCQILYTKSADTTQTITVKPKSLLDFYGLPGGGATGSAGCKFQNFTYHGKLLLEAAAGSTPGGKILIHGGATLQIQDEITLELKSGSQIDFAFEQNLLPPWQTTDPALQNQTTGLNIPTTGKMLLNGTFISNSATLTANLPTEDSALVILVNDALRITTTLPQLQFDANNTSFLCIPSTGRSNMLIKWISPSSLLGPTFQQYRKINIDNCTFTGASLSITNPVAQVDILNSDFDGIYADPFIKFTWDREDNTYGIINVKDNSLNFTQPASGGFPIMEQGIEFHDFTERRTSSFNKITIQDNEIFNTAQWSGGAILLNTTSALVLGNNIHGTGIGWGIRNRFTSPTVINPRSNSFFCSNTIDGCGEGIRTMNWIGYGKLNTITNSTNGHISEASDRGGLTHTEISESGVGIELYDDVTRLNLSGVHNTTTDAPAFNILYHNAGQTPMAEIVINGSILILGTSSTNSSTFANYAHNNITTSTSSKKFIHDYASTPTDVGGVNENFWGYGTSGSETVIANTTDFDAQLSNVTYLPSSPSFASSTFSAPSTPECGVEYDFGTGKRKVLPQSVEFDTTFCDWLVDRGERNFSSELYDRAYDTLRLYIESCANHKNSWAEFAVIGASVQFQLGPQERYIGLREWLKKVLYYNTTVPNYYCADVQEIMTSFFYFEGRGKDYLGALAVAKEIYDRGLCQNWDFIYDYGNRYKNTMDKVAKLWRDTVQDSLATPLDTTLPSLEELDLTILRGPNQGAVSPVAREPHLGELIATRNPFTDILELKYRLDKSAMVRIDVYDLLGRAVYSEGQGYKAEGEHVLSLQSKGWTSGSYYVRLSSPSGEVKTVKVVKE